jgi:protoporphyrinogen oxidase
MHTDSTGRIRSVIAKSKHGDEIELPADYVFSSMPVRHLIRALDIAAPENVKSLAEGLVYRDFITVGLLLEKLRVTEPDGSPIRDNWIYIQEADVQVGRLQIFNNWSPYMVADRTKTWVGLEYFCNDTDPMWHWSDTEMSRFAAEELQRIGLASVDDVLDSVVIRMPKTYPAYFGAYADFQTIREYVDGIPNLFLVGRNGMHRYNNQDHSMLTAMVAVDNIAAGLTDKSNIWDVNTEEEYLEEK